MGFFSSFILVAVDWSVLRSTTRSTVYFMGMGGPVFIAGSIWIKLTEWVEFRLSLSLCHVMANESVRRDVAHGVMCHALRVLIGF
jgi:hypothetical protein